MFLAKISVFEKTSDFDRKHPGFCRGWARTSGFDGNGGFAAISGKTGPNPLGFTGGFEQNVQNE